MKTKTLTNRWAILVGLTTMIAAGASAQQGLPLTSLRTDGIKADQFVSVPASSMEGPWDIGRNAHTHILEYHGPAIYTSEPQAMMLDYPSHGPTPPISTGPSGFHPSQIRTAYNISGQGSGVIAIVDAYHYAAALSDFNKFASSFSLPQETSTNATASTNKVFQVVYASGKQPNVNTGWNEEAALDIEWAHAVAPGAKIVLVEANSSGFGDLLAAVTAASKITGVTQISMSWGGSEFSGETSYDSTFSAIKTASLFVSTGDNGGSHNYPAMSPNVVAVGGTSLFVTSNGAYSNENGWSGSGGGISGYEAAPTFQKSSASTNKFRTVPDISAVADPYTGVSIYCSPIGGWTVVGGTSLSAPLCAAIANVGGQKAGNNEITNIYKHTSLFNDVKTGSAGSNKCAIGYDLVTGWGSPKSGSSL